MASNEQWARDAATAFRVEQSLGILPIKDVFELVHLAIGIDVFSIEAAEEEHGLTMLDPATGRRVIVVATTPNPMRQRSSVAHELGHLLRGDLDSIGQLAPGERSPAEICADAFARHLLLPIEAVRHRLPGRARVTVNDLSDLVQEFEVSPVIAAIQLRSARRVAADAFEEWKALSSRHLAAQFGWLSQYDSLVESSLKPRAPQLLMRRAVTGYQAGVLGIAELSAWYGQTADSLREELGEPLEPAGLDRASASRDRLPPFPVRST